MKRTNRLSIAVSLVMLCLIVANLLTLSRIRAAMGTGQVVPEWLGGLVAVAIILIGLLHVAGLAALVGQLLTLRNTNWGRVAAFVVGCFSLFLLAADVMMLSDIGHEALAGYDTVGEWRMVYGGHAVHALYAVLLLAQCVAAARALGVRRDAVPAMKDETLFLTIPQLGIVSSVLGLVCVLWMSRSGVPAGYLGGLLFMLCVVLVAPYAMAAAWWFVTKRKERPADWYDEKQFADLSRGALLALVTLVLLSAVVYLFVALRMINIDIFIFLPVYLFLALLIFSGGTLYLNRRY